MPQSGTDTPVVYVVNYAGHDITDAKKFTTQPFVFVTEGFVPFSEQTQYEMAKKLRNFQSEDFLLLSGSTALAAMAVAILKENNKIESINVLVYNAKQNKYTPHRIGGKIHLPAA